MNYTVTVRKNDVLIETHYFESHLKARQARLELQAKYADGYIIEIDEVE